MNKYLYWRNYIGSRTEKNGMCGIHGRYEVLGSLEEVFEVVLFSSVLW